MAADRATEGKQLLSKRPVFPSQVRRDVASRMAFDWFAAASDQTRLAGAAKLGTVPSRRRSGHARDGRRNAAVRAEATVPDL